MDFFTLTFSISILVLSWYFITHFFCNLQNLPPSPYCLPIIGHLHLIRHPIHETLSKLSKHVGPVMLLRLGHRKVVHITSPSAAEDCLLQNGAVCANRPRLLTGEIFGYGSQSLIWSQYGSSWRNLRRIANTQILSPVPLQQSLGIRSHEVKTLIRQTLVESSNELVEIGKLLFDITHDIMMTLMAKERFMGEESTRFRLVMTELMNTEGISTMIDFLPWLSYFGIKGIVRKRFSDLAQEKESFLIKLMEKHRTKMKEDNNMSKEKKTLIEVLLSLQKSEAYTDEMIKGLFQVLLLAGPDSSAGTMEWALTLLLNNPEILNKAHCEIDTQVGHDRLVDESDLPNLPYLRCIIYETLRLYPAAPMLIPHESSDKCIIGGYTIPGGTMLLVNVWAIQNDPNNWVEPGTFKPERFQGLEQGSEQMKNKFMPFGLGRRSCPGEAMAMRMVGLALASLLQCFEWERPGPELIDMSVKTGLALPKAKPLQAKCHPRHAMENLISQM